MLLGFVGPLIVVAVNLPLAVWAVARAPRNPSHRTFALLALSLAAWNLGGAGLRAGGVESIALRLALLGLALAPANFLCLALNARRNEERGDAWLLLLYLPAITAACLIHPTVATEAPHTPSWRIGLYALGAPEARAFAGLSAAYLAGALWFSWRDASRGVARDWMFKLVQAPMAFGTLAVAAVGLLRREKSPNVSLWVMVMSQYAMFMMMRYRMVPLQLSLRRSVTLAFSGIALGLCALLGILLIRPLFGQVLDEETVLLLVAGAVALCVLYAALLPQLEAFFERLFGGDRRHEDGES
jgi:hypothetical protein